jgi:hypothetical protein
MAAVFSEKKLHRIDRLDIIIKDFFEENPDINEIAAKDLMPLFIKKGIFLQDHRNGFPIRILLNELNRENKLQLFKHIKVIRHTEESAWYFVRS